MFVVEKLPECTPPAERNGLPLIGLYVEGLERSEYVSSRKTLDSDFQISYPEAGKSLLQSFKLFIYIL